jgi:nucleotide-binding universal stress UspA family protein
MGARMAGPDHGYAPTMDTETLQQGGATTATGGLRVMIATDGSDAACAAAEQATQLLAPDADYFLVTIIDPQLDPMEYAGGIEGPALDEAEVRATFREAMVDAEGALARTARSFGARPVAQRIVERNGAGVGARICELAQEERVEVIVVGSRHRRAIVDLMLGSVGTYVLDHSPCPVLVVRRPES